MAAPSYLLAAAALLVAAPVISARRSGMIEPFVIGGQDAEPGQFPELVSIQAVGQHMCGGFIIDKYWIVTAGHCLDQVDPAAVSILAGTTDLTSAEGVRMSIGGYEIHEDYDVKDDYSLTHDIALIKMDDPLPIGDNIQIGTLQNIPTNDGDQVVVAGWGWTSNEQQRTSNTLQYAPLQVLSNAKCQDVLSEYSLPDNVICAGSPDSQEAECRGDSGGPLYSDGMVVGIVSWSKKPCGKFPGVYASIARHYDWIRNTSGLESL